MKKSYLLLLFTAFTAFWSCQKDIPLLGQDENGDTVIVPKTMVFIRSIILSEFPYLNPADALPWDNGSVLPFDSTDFKGPDIFYSIQHYDETPPPGDTLAPFYYYQSTHFQDVSPLPADTPLVYYVTDTIHVPDYYSTQTIYLRLFDFESGATIDSTLIDSIPFKIGPDNSLHNPYITSVSGTGVNGSRVTLGLEWK